MEGPGGGDAGSRQRALSEAGALRKGGPAVPAGIVPAGRLSEGAVCPQTPPVRLAVPDVPPTAANSRLRHGRSALHQKTLDTQRLFPGAAFFGMGAIHALLRRAINSYYV